MKRHFSFPRSNRIADLIRQEVALLFLNGIRDPRLQGLTITDVKVTDDLSVARIYYVTCEKKENPEVVKALGVVKGFISREIAKNIKIRKMPELEFYYDEVFENGMDFEEKLRSLRNEGRG